MAFSTMSTRRGFLWSGAALAASRAAAQEALTAAQVIERIKANVGVDWAAETVDKIVAGAPETPVKGIATTMMATLDVIQRASKAGLNLVITHEPTFYSHLDTVDDLAGDETYRYKAGFIEKHDVVVFRFHDHWHRRRPDGIGFGMARELGWEQYADPENARLFKVPTMSLAKLARQIESKLGAATVRVVGDPAMPVTRVRANWGYLSLQGALRALGDPDVDVLVAGESREWEGVEYAEDLVASGKKKGLIVIGHIASEQAGMKYCAEWLKTFIGGVPIEFVPAGEPFWSPGT